MSGRGDGDTNLTVVGALYVDLAEQRTAALVTTDAHLAAAHPDAEMIEA